MPAPKRASLDYIDAVDLMDKGMMDRFKGKTLKMLWVTAGLFELNEDRTVSNDLLPIKWDSVCDKMYEPMLLNSNIVFYGDDNDELETLGSFSSSSKYAPNILIQVSEQVDEMVDIIMGHGSEGWNLLAKRYKRLVSAIDHHMANTAALHSPLGNSASLERLLEVSGASASKSHGTQLFKQGKYLPALVAYADAISAVVVLCVSAAVFGAEVDPQTGVPVVSPSGMQSTITFANMTLPLYLACLLNAALIGNILCKEENISKFGDRWEQEDLAMASCRCCDIALELLGVDYFNSSPDCRNGMYTRSPSLLPSGIVAGCSIKMWIAKALFRRGQALVFLGALEQAEADLRAAEALVPMDRAISEERETVTRARAQLLSPEERKRERARRKKEKKKAKTRHLDASILVQTQEAVLQASHSPSSEIDLPQSRSSDLCLEFSEKAPEALKDICSEERRKEKQRKKKERRKAKKGHQQLVPQTIDDHEEMERNGAVSAEKEVLKAEAGENEERLRQEKLKAKREKREAIKAQRRAEAEAAAAAKKKRQQVEEARKQAAQDCIAAAEAAHKAAIERARQIAAIEEKEREELLQARQKELETLRDAELKSEKVEQAKSPADLGPITHALEEEDVPRRICENVNVETDYVDGVVPEKEFSQSDSGKSELSRMCAPILSGNQRSAELQKHGPYEEAQSSDRLQEVDSNHSAEYLLHGGKFLSKPSWDNVTEITASLSADEVDAITFGEDAVQERLNALKVTDLSNMASSSPDCCTTYFPTSSKWEDGSATQHFVEGVDNMQSAGAEVETVSSVVSALPGFQSRHDGLSVPVEEMINQIYNAEPFRQNLHDVDAPEHLNNASSMPVGLTASMEERDIFSRAMIDVQEQSRERAPSDERGIEGCPSKVYPSMQETQNIWSAALAPNCEHSASNGHNAYPQWSNGRVPAELCQGFTWQRPELLTGAWDQSNANPDLKESLSWAPVDQNVGGNQGRPWPWSTPVDPCSGYNVPSANNFYPTGNDAYVDRNAWDQGQAWGTRRQEGNPMQTDNLCMLCRLRPKDALPVPCGHACACFECLSAVQLMPGQGQCPVCLVPIQRVQRVILS